jgi:hypothetical protein
MIQLGQQLIISNKQTKQTNMTSTTNNNNSQNNTSANQTTFTSNDQFGVRMESRPITSISSRKNTPSIIGKASSIIREDTWTLDKMLNRRNFVVTIPLSSTQSSHTVLHSLRLPEDAINNNLTSSPFSSFIFWRGKIILEFQITGVPQIQGCIAITWIPLCESKTNDMLVENFSALSVNQTCYLYPNANTSATMEIPFNSTQAYLDIEKTTPESIVNTLGHVKFVVFNQLELGATASDTASISVFARFEDNLFKVPRRSGITSRKYMTPRVQSSTAEASPGPLGFLKKIAKSILPEDIIGDAIDLATGFIGLDKPIDPTLQERSKIVSTQPMNFTSGVERIDVLGYNPSALSLTDPDTFATTNDEMTFSHIFQKYSYLGSFSMNTGQEPGTILASIPINPCPNRLVDNTTSQVSLLQYATSPFTYWTGGLTYQGAIIATSFQTGKILISFNYNEFTPSIDGVLTSDASQYAIVIELNQGSNQFEFTIPYIAATPKLHVPSSNTPSHRDTMGMINISVLNTLVNQNGTPPQIHVNLFIAGADDYQVDTISINQLMPVILPVPPAPIQRKLKYIRESSLESDIEVVMLPRHRERKATVRPQSSAQPLITPMSNTDMATENLISPSEDATTPRQDVSQSHLYSVRNILRKYQMLPTQTMVTPSETQRGRVLVLPVNSFFGIDPFVSGLPTSSTRTPVAGLFTKFSLLYRQFKGGLNFKIMLQKTQTNYTFAAFYSPPIQGSDTQTATRLANVLANNLFLNNTTTDDLNNRSPWLSYPNLTSLPVNYINGIDATAEFNVPYSSKYLSVLAPLGATLELPLTFDEVSDLGYIYIFITDAISTQIPSINLNMFISLGDDARFGTLYNVPKLAPLAMQTETGAFIDSAYPGSYSTSAPIVNTLVTL